MLERPPSPHDLIGDNWPAIDEVALAALSTALLASAAASQTAEQRAYADGNVLQGILIEGFEKQVEAPFRVGGMAADLAGALEKAAAETSAVAQAVLSAKVNIVVTVGVAEALIAAKEIEIAALQATPLRPGIRAMRIQQLRNEIQQVTSEAKSDIQAMYNGIYTPAAPPAPGLSPIVHTGPPASSGAGITPASTGRGTTSALDSQTSTGRGTTASESQSPMNSESTGPQSDPVGSRGTTESANDPVQTEMLSDTRGSLATPSASEPSVAAAVPPMSPSAPSAASGSAGSLSGASSAMPKVGSVSAPTSGASSASGLSSTSGSGLSSVTGGAPSAPSASTSTPAQQFMSGATQGLVSPGTAASGASASTAAAQPFRPPPGAMMPAGPPPASTATPVSPAAAAPAAGAPLASAPAAGTPLAAAPAAGAVPMAPPPAAGVPNVAAPPPATAAPVAPVAPATPGAGGPAPAAPPPMMRLGARNPLLRAFKSGAHTAGEGLRATPGFAAAMSLVAALNDPQKPGSSVLMGGWSCAVFGSGDTARFVVAERHGLSWIPAGVYLPDGVVVAHLDERVPAEERMSWRGLSPSALVLSKYARAIGEQPRVVVARAYEPGLDGWFDRHTVLAADYAAHVIIPNPVVGPDEGGCHRLMLASPDDWARVEGLGDDELASGVRSAAECVVESHNAFFSAEWWWRYRGAPEPGADAEDIERAAADAALRQEALGQVGAAESGEKQDKINAVAARMLGLAPQLVGCPVFGGLQHSAWLLHNELEMQLRGWEALLLALNNEASRINLGDVVYAYRMATQAVLPVGETEQ